MKKALILVAAIAMISFSHRTGDPLTQKERDYADKFLKKTKTGVIESIKGLSEAQLKFKPSAESWGVEECLKHIAVTEQALWGMLDANLKEPATPEKRSEVKLTDEELIKRVEDRSSKVKTLDPFQPENTPFKTAEEALESFKTNRARLADYVKTTKDDLRNHVLTLPFGSIDGYQFVLFISAHTNRHTQQIEEVKANAAFPRE